MYAAWADERHVYGTEDGLQCHVLRSWSAHATIISANYTHQDWSSTKGKPFLSRRFFDSCIRGRVITSKCHYSRSVKTPNCHDSEVSKLRKYLCHAFTPLPRRPENYYYNPLAVRVHPPVPAFGVLHVKKNLKSRSDTLTFSEFWHFGVMTFRSNATTPS